MNVCLNSEVTAEQLKADGFEAVFLAVGGKPIVPDLPGIDKAVTAEDVLSGQTPVSGENVVVIGGGVPGLETAETLAKDYKVTVVEMLAKVGGNLYPSVTMHLVQEIMKTGGVIAKEKALTEVGDGFVMVKDMQSGEVTKVPADCVVLAMGVRSDRSLVDSFKAVFADKVILVGDCAKAGQIYDALHSAHDRAFVFDN